MDIDSGGLLRSSIGRLYNYLSSYPVGGPESRVLPPQTALACSMVMAFDGLQPPLDRSNCPPAPYPARQPPGAGSFAERIFDTAVFRNALAASAAAGGGGGARAASQEPQQIHPQSHEQYQSQRGAGGNQHQHTPVPSDAEAGNGSSGQDGGGGGGAAFATTGSRKTTAADHVTLAAIEALAGTPGMSQAKGTPEVVVATIAAGFGSFHSLAAAFAVGKDVAKKWDAAAAAAAAVSSTVSGAGAAGRGSDNSGSGTLVARTASTSLQRKLGSNQQSSGKLETIESKWSVMSGLIAGWTALSSAEKAPTDFDAARDGLGILLALRPAPIAELSSAIEAALAGMSRSCCLGSSTPSASSPPPPPPPPPPWR